MFKMVWIFILVVILATGLFAPLNIGGHPGGNVDVIDGLGQSQSADLALSGTEMGIIFIGVAEAG